MTDSTYRRTVLVLGAIVLFGLALRIPGLGDSFYGDEGFSLLRDSKQFLTGSEDRFRPVFFSLLYLWRQLGFSGEIGLRLLPLIFGVAQIPVAYFLGKRLGGERLARVFAVLIAASPLLIEFSQELRMYSLVALIALAHALALLRLAEKPTIARWGLFVLLGLMGVYTHLHYWLFMAGMTLSLIRERRAMGLWKGLAAQAVVLLGYLPNLANVQSFVQMRSSEYAVHVPSALPKLVAAFTVGFNYFAIGENGRSRAIGNADLLRNWPLLLLLAVVLGIVLWLVIRLHLGERCNASVMLCHELFTVPILLALAAMLVTRQYWLQPKYVIFSAPFALLLIAESFAALNGRGLSRALTLSGFIVWAIAMMHSWNPHEYGRREDWRQAASVLKSAYTPQTAVVVLEAGFGLLEYYWPEAERELSVVGMKQGGPWIPVDSMRTVVEGKKDVYYVWSDVVRNLADPNDEVVASLDRLGRRIETIQLNPRLVLYHWRLPG